jgi:hypothetical protein
VADRYWVNDDADGDWEGTNNWSTTSGGAGGAATPTGSDDVFFNAASSNDNCSMSANAACLSMTIGTSGSAYTGTLDAATFDVAIGTGGLDCTFGGSATLDLGSGTWSCSGNWNHRLIGTLTLGTSTVDLTGTSKTLEGDKNKNLYNLTISGTISIAAATNTRQVITNVLDITGTLTIDSDSIQINGGDLQLSGTLAGSQTLSFVSGSTFSTNSGTYSISNTTINRCDISVPGGTYAGTWTIDNGAVAEDKTITFGNAGGQTLTFTGSVTIDADRTSQTTTINTSTHNPNLVFQGGLTLAESAGTLAWSKGSGSMTLSGSNDQTITNPAGWTTRREDLTINKSAGNLVFSGPQYYDSFTGTDTGTGDFDPGGATIDVTGNCSWAAAFDFDSAADCLNGSDWQIDGNFTASVPERVKLNIVPQVVLRSTLRLARGLMAETTPTGTSGPWGESWAR